MTNFFDSKLLVLSEPFFLGLPNPYNKIKQCYIMVLLLDSDVHKEEFSSAVIV